MNEEEYENNFYEDKYDSEDSYDDDLNKIEYLEYLQDTVSIIFEEFSFIINKRDLPIGEYITPKKIEKFIQNFVENFENI